jgi:hypothetical protein
MSTNQPSSNPTRLDLLFRALAILSAGEFAALIYTFLNFEHGYAVSGAPLLFRVVEGLVIGPMTIVISALIIWRVPGNVVGRFLLLYGIGFVGWQFSYDFGDAQASSIAFEIFFAYWGMFGLTALIYLIINFPSGQVYPPWIRPVAQVFAGTKVIGVILELLSMKPGTTAYGSTIQQNPFFVAPLEHYQVWISSTIGSQGLVTLLGILLAVVSLVLRYRVSQGEQRRQIRWLAWSAGIMVPFVFGFFIFHLGLQFSEIQSGPLDLLTYFAIATLPVVAIGIAILRNRLFDIDIIIRRTLIYGVLTALLAVVYFGSVILLQQVFRGITGATQSEIVTIISTLAIAALFNPLRHRVQSVIDRRFYRNKYDAQQVLARFAQVARDEVELEKLTGELLSVVQNTMQPASVGLWMKQTKNSNGR